MRTLSIEFAATLAYAVAGVVLMVIGYLLVDLATPGRLRELIWTDRNHNATILLGSNIVAVGAIVTAAIAGSEEDFLAGIVSTLGYGLLGLLIMTAAFVLLDLATPGRLGRILVDPQPHPAVWISAVVHLVTGAIVAAAIL